MLGRSSVGSPLALPLVFNQYKTPTGSRLSTAIWVHRRTLAKPWHHCQDRNSAIYSKE